MFQDKAYYSSLLHIGLPIALSNFITNAISAVGVLFIGQLGEVPLAAVGLANQIYFLLSLMLFGVGSGSGIFTAQYWGARDTASIRKISAISLIFCLFVGSGFTVIGLFFPGTALGFFTEDAQVIALGSQYLRIISWSYLVNAVTISYNMQLRATGLVRIPTAVSVVCLSFGSLLNYVLIFGKLGFPAMGVDGAALGTCIARFIEFGALVGITHAKKFPTAVHLSALSLVNGPYFRKYLVTVLPVFFNETMWSLGISIYNGVYAHISTESVAAINITSTVENMAFVLFIGLANACGIMIGNSIGAGEGHKSMVYARRSLILSLFGAVITGIGIVASSNAILSLYKVSDAVLMYAHNVLIVVAIVLLFKVANLVIVVGILRAGGDTRFTLAMDMGTVWLVGIPMALLGAFVFHLPVYWVVAMVAADEISKMGIGLYRVSTGKWVNNLTVPQVDAA